MGVEGVEIVVGETITHARYLIPGDCRFTIEQLPRDRLDCFADLDQPDPYSVEDEAVGQVTPSEVPSDSWAMSASASASASANR